MQRRNRQRAKSSCFGNMARCNRPRRETSEGVGKVSKSQPRTGHTRGKGPGKNTADENNTRPMHEEQPASDPPSPSHTLSHTHTVRKARPSVAHSRGQALPAPPRHRHHLGLLSVRPSVARALRSATSSLLSVHLALVQLGLLEALHHLQLRRIPRVGPAALQVIEEGASRVGKVEKGTRTLG